MNERDERIGDDWLDLQQPERQKAVIETQELAEKLQRYYVCAGCWGHLTLYHAPERMVRIVCDKCGDGRGFVTKRFAEGRRSDSIGEAMDVRKTLQMMGVLAKSNRTADQVLADLGF